MDATSPQVRREPGGMTLSDLVILGVGSAIALAIPKMELIRPWPYPSCFSAPPTPPPDWGIRFGEITEFGLKWNLAIALVALLRCWRWGRTPRPAEWLVFLAAFSLLELIRFEPYGLPRRCLIEFVCSLEGPYKHSDFWMFAASEDVWDVTLGTAIVLMCAAVIARFRGRLPVSLKTTLMIAAAYALFSGPATRAWKAILDVDYLDTEGRFRIPGLLIASRWLCWLSSGLIFGITTAATIRAWRYAQSRRWFDWLLLIALAPFALYSTSLWFVSWSHYSVTRETVIAGARALTLQLALVVPLSLLALRWLGPIWNRRLGLGYDGIEVASSPSEA